MDISQDTERHLRRLREASEALQVPDAVDEALRDLADVVSHTSQLAPHLIDDARRQGATWAQVGAAFGISAQGAHQRFGKKA